jgi:hypothetical protein
MGTKMRKDAMADLQVKESIGNFQSVTDSDSLFNSESFKGKKWLVAVIGADSLRMKHLTIFKNIFKQSKEEFDVNVFTIVGLYSGELIPDMGKQFELPLDRKWIKTYMAAQHVYVFSADAFVIPEAFQNKNLAILVDEKGNIRNYYSLEDETQVVNLVRQVPVFLSLK